MRRPHSAAPPQHGHRLSRPQSGAPVRPVSAATSRQRGFYSEYLPSDVELQPKTSPSGHRGSHSKARLGVARQKLTAARLFDSKLAEEMLGAAILASDPAQSSGDATAERPPMRAYEPKVNAPFKGLAGKAPRPILIERRKRLFALQSIEKLLREEHGIDTTLPETEGALPLHLFDNTDFDPRTVDEWLALAVDEATGETRWLPGRYVHRQQRDGVREWRDCQVVGRNPTDGTWRIVEDQHSSSPQAPVGSTRAWEDPSGHFASDAAAAAEPTERSVHRVDLLFLAEDVFVFASRVAAAHAARRAAMDSLRFELYIDCVPPENGPPAPEAEATSRLLARALNSDALRSRRAAAQAMLAEVAADRDRTLTVVRFRAMAEAAHAAEAFDATVVSIFNKVPLPPPTWARPSAPALGMVADAPAHRCLARGNFHLTSLLTTGEAVTAAQRVKAECEAALRLPLLQTHWSKPATIDEYTEAQSRVTDGAAAHLREGWAGAIRNAIRHSLRDVGKGWFNLNEKDIEVYQVSKLKRLLAMLNLVVQDTIVALGEASLRAYADLVVARAAFRVVLHSSSDVALERLPEAQEAADKAAAANAAPPAPLFQLDLGVIDGVGFEYVHPPEEFAEEAVNAYMRAVGATQGLPQLERSVMPPSLISGSAPMATLDLTDGAVPRHLVRVREALHRALPHPQTYLALLSPYVPTAQLDVPAHVAKLGVASRSVSEIAADAREQLRRAAAVEAELPPRVNLGLFSVNAAPARDFLAQRHKEVARQLLGVVKARVSAAGADVTASFAAIENSLRRKLPDIEAVAELEEYIAALPSELMPLQESLRAMTREHAALDEFWTNLSDAEHSTYWKTLAWPRRIALRIGDAQAMCEAQRKVFASEMAVEQQTFDRSIERLERSVANYARRTDFEKADEVAAEVDRLTIDLQEAEEKRALFNRREVIFGTKATDYSALTKATKEFEPYAALWTTVRAWTASRREWMTGSFQAVNAEQMEAQLGSTSRTMHKLAKVFEGSAGLSEIARQISTEVDAFAPHMPVVMAMRNLGMRDRHWELMSKETGVDMKCVQAKSFTFEALLELDLGSQIEEIAKVADSAGKEYAIEQALDKMQAEWAEVLVETVEYRESGTHVLRGSDAVQQLLDDHIVMTQSMAFSPYKGPFARRIDLWEKTLASISDIYEEWLLVQRAWMYLEPVFSSDDIMRQLPAEGKRFISVDRAWRRLMATASQRSSVVDYCRNTPRLLQILRNANAALELVQKGLAEYLETKRIAFARFYFLSNDELLEILSETRDPKRIQPHLKKCFENIDKLVFEPDEQMTAMVSGEGEVVPFTKGLYATGGVEIWMGNVLEEMQTTVRRSILEAWEDYGQTPRGKWVLRWPGATLIAGSNIAWTLEVEAALNENGNAGLRKYFDVVHSQLLELTRIVSGEVTKLQRKSLGALITIDVHQRDVVGSMADAGVSTTAAFEWISQLRYELASEKAGKKDPFNPSKSTIMPGDCLVKQLDGWFKYGNEYLGNSMRLVITPLTDRIYLTLTGALQLFLGGAPAGPAGTGKTETTKDLAKALAKQCLVFNCGPELDYLAMGKFFRGLAMSGAWACFDEFNRIDLEVLSVVAQQVSSIQQAMAAGLRRFEFEGNDISLDATCAIFITMNPGYTGRSELPDNLKALFRPVACMVPDYAMIAEIRLYSFGYTDARRLSQKMVKTFQLASEQVSSQDHYDFGMRAVNTVIQAAGNNRAADPSGVEDLLVLSALADSNRPKFLAEDMQLFESILSDLFPGVQVPTPDYTDLLDALRRQCDAAALIPTEAFVAKCVQIYEVSVLRHGFMTVGPSGGGKSAAKEVLLAAQAELDVGPDSKYRRHRQWFLNPKAVTMGQLYGQFDENTHEWSDGILCILYRAAVKEFAEYGKTEKQWLVFDGPVDALWIESMNTVLDDNRKLCLVSGEIITMTPHMIMVFEVEDLAVASPATVSRVGTIYMEPERVVGTDAQMHAWLMALPALIKQHQRRLAELLQGLVPPLLAFVRKTSREFMATLDNSLVASTLNLLSTFWTPFLAVEGIYTPSPDMLAALPLILERAVVFSVVWGIGASSDSTSRRAFDVALRARVTELHLDAAVALPDLGLAYDYAINLEPCESSEAGAVPSRPFGGFVGWMQTVPELQLLPKVAFHDIIVPTSDTVRYAWLLEALLTHGRHMLAVGPTGTGKTLNVANKLLTAMPSRFLPLFVGFSAQTSANATQDQIDAKLDKRRKGIFGPPAGKKYAVFVDDANMPKREEYGAQPPVELLRQSLGQGGWYDRKTHEFRTIVDVSYVAVMGPPGGGRHAVTNRFLRYFHCVAFPELDDASMRQIFGAILRTFATAYLPEQLLDCCTPIINAAIDLYKTLLRELLPTPAKPHYTFNLRDLASVVQGLLSADPKTTKTSADLTRLWLHESMRVFRDRLICADDRTWFDGTLRSLVSLHLGAWEDAIAVEPGHLFYGDFMSPGVEPKVYIEITDIEKMGRVVEECLEDYNAVNTKRMPLVIFVDAVAHVARISRVLRQPRGNALLLGVGGSGRQSLTQLAAAMADYEIFQIEISKSYGLAEWREDLKKTLLIAGEDGKNVVLLFTDTQVLYESFLEDVNSLLNAGDVPNLLDENDTNEIVASMRPLAQAAGQPLTKVALYNFFVKRVRAKLHLVICMSPASEAFSRRLRSFPSLVNNCTIDFFSEWPQEALKSVASSALECAELGREHDAVISCIGKVHQSVEAASIRFLAEQRRYNYVTPTSYLEVLSTFNSLLALKRKEVSTAKRRLETGLHKLQTTEVEVEALKQQIEEMQPLLIRTCEEVEVMMGQIRVDSAEADATRAAVARDEEVASQKAAECQQIKDSAEKDLAEALPALDAAVAVLRNLKLSDLSEVAKYANPPAGVKLVTEAMCVLKGVPAKMVGSVGQKTADYWEPGKKMLSDAKGLLESMFTFDKDNIPEKIIVKLQPYITNPDFAPDKIESISKACTAMCQWVLAMNKYHFVALEVEPKRKALISAEEELDLLTWSLTQLRDGLQEVQIKIQGLEAKYNASVAQKEELAARLADATVKQDRAARLLGGLGGEKVRWRGTVASLKQAEANIIGDVCVAASAVAYSGPFTSEYRLSLAKCWRKHLLELGIQHSEGASVSRVMADPVRVRRWQEHGLPADTVSTENGLILANARRWPLSIDPQAQANKWIRSMEAEQQLAVCKPSDTDFVRTLENAVRFGKPVLFENVLSTLDPALEPILLKQTYKQGGSDVMKIGDAIIPYHPDFKFYLTSKLSNPHYAPEASVKVALLNFTVTSEGLEDQLLGLTVAKERPDLEESKSKLVVSSAQMAYQLNDIGSTILRLLSESSGDILDDEDLISTLSQSKVMSDEISAKAAEAAATEKEIDQTRDQYRPVAVRAALLFFCVADMAKVDPMYQYSINWFTTLFVRSIEEAPQSQDIAQRLQSLSDHFTHLLYENICRSLFEAHKLLFSFCAAVSILRGSGHVNANEWRFLITGSSLDRVDEPNPDPSWLTPAVWSLLTSLATLPAFAGIHASVRDALADWRSYFESSQTHLSPLPGEWDVQLGEMQKLCVLRCVRPDKVVPGMQLFVRNLLGQRFVETPAFDLSTSFRDSTNVLPIVFVLSPGADPADSLLKFAAEAKMGKKLTSISLGQGQGPIAERHMAYAVQTGLWVLLQNCHLAASWMPRLEAIVEQYVAEETHKDYRLWLTSMPSSQFPVSILQNSVKITIEPPRGIKMNMIGSYAAFTDKILNGHPKYDAYKRLLYGLSFFHALLQDRRKFGPLGFNVSYEFTTGDLQCCMLQLETFLARYDEVPFAMLVHLFGHINYGGRITDDFDRRMVMTVLKSVMNEGLLKDGFQLAPGEHYRAPPAGQVSDYRAAIGELPVTPHPNVFGLNENADISCAQAETSTLCDILVALQPKVSSGAGRDRDEAVAELATALLERRLEPFPLEVITLRYPLRYDESMNTVLTQECIRYNKLIVAFNCTLSDLLKALKGVVVMSSELEAMAHALYSNQVPALWTAISYPSLKPLVAWVDDLVQRIAFVKSWVDEGPPPLFWISGFYFPQAFLTGTLQNYARRESVAIDTVSFAYIVLLAEDESASDKPETGCYISGLFLEGAGWDTSRKVLVESRPKQLFLAFPPIWLKPTVDRALPTKKVYSCPVYKTLTRAGTLSTTGHSTNFVLAIELPSDQLCEGVFSRYAEGFSPLWIKRAVALFCALNY